jgi:hypothetical protein
MGNFDTKFCATTPALVLMALFVTMTPWTSRCGWEFGHPEFTAFHQIGRGHGLYTQLFSAPVNNTNMICEEWLSSILLTTLLCTSTLSRLDRPPHLAPTLWSRILNRVGNQTGDHAGGDTCTWYYYYHH